MKPVLAVVALLAVSACAGPTRPLDVGFREVPSDVILGAQATTSPATPSSGGVLPLPTGILTLPPPVFPVSAPPGAPLQVPARPTPTPAACPTTDPLAAPRREAFSTIAAPPRQDSYVFLNVGSYRVSGADSRSGTFPATTVRSVGNVVASGSGFSYDVTEQIADTTTVTTFRVASSGTVPAPGVYLVALHYRRTDGTTSSFTPTPSLELAALPLVRGATLDAKGVDGLSQTTETFTSTVRGKARVAACGEPLDSWTIDLSAGRVLSPTQDLTFAATYQLATQFGGIVVKDSVAFAGTDNGAGVSRSNVATIASTPRSP
ncbi:MAG: hypothetical protein M3N21_09090 [Actinomycetota bacterium]|nr:hypothetical protein [Actinomycetota bacterium]